MIRNGQRLLNLINQLLDISKLEAGKMQLQATSTDLTTLLRHIASSYESMAADKKIKYFFYPEMQELMVYADQEKIKKIVHNILSNAFKFTTEGGEVILHLKTQENQWALISVKDTGTGIPAEEVDKVFDRFYQVDSSQTRTHEGSGLGMALAKELVEMHHGRITVESKAGKGTTFTVWLPLGKAHLRPEEISEKADAETSEKYSYQLAGDTEEVVEAEVDAAMVETNNNPLILVVEDNADMRHYIRSTLGNDYQVREAENGKEGLILAKELLPDLILSDIMMPEMDGFRLCERVKTHELTSHIPVILLTAKADRKSKLTGLETGADDYLSKPFDAEELQLIIRNRIEERRKLRERFSRDITLEPRSISITSLDEQFLTKVLDIIEEHMDDETFTIEDLGREAGYSKVHFYRKIKALTDQSPSQFLRTVRLKRAATLLQQKSDTISQIAYRVGFNNLSYFNKCFKEQFGRTPGQYATAEQEVK
jgi:CheY-like chemotaxis protein/two-component sensor histidine kinase